MAKAEENFRLAISLKPDYGEAYQGLSEIIRFKDKDPILANILVELDKKPNKLIASYLNFAAGKIYDDCKNYTEAFKHYEMGNSLSEHHWSASKIALETNNIINTYNRSYFKANPSKGLKTDIPIFIIGMPRSGSTLVEQILSSHSLVFGAGEINDIHSISKQIHNHSSSKEPYPTCMTNLTQDAFEGFGKAYMQRVLSLQSVGNKAHKTVDKFLFNFMHLGLIYDLLPQAQIIHTTRHPLDICLSCFFQNFSSKVDWSFKLEDIIQFYRNYRTLMSHWQKTLPTPIFEIKYEDLINQAELKSKALVQFCGLPWEEGCINFHLNKRKVQTASFWQVRQPIYKRSNGRWKNYENFIQVLREELKDYIQEYEK